MFRRIVETSRFLLAVLDEEMRITYASPVCLELLGFAPEEMIGLDALSLLHPDDRDVAVGAIVQLVAEAKGRVGVGIPLAARVRTREGAYRSFEIGAQVALDDPAVAGVILRLRPIEGQAFLDLALRELVAGADLEDVLLLLARAAEAEVSPAAASVSYDWDGARFRSAVSTGLASELAGTEATRNAPWATALDGAVPVDFTLDELPPAVAEPARRGGFAGCWVVPVAMVHADLSACLFVWRHEPDAPWVSHLVALDRIAGLVALAFRHRHDENLLVHAALHDGLTGLPNRRQFFQRVEAAVEATREDGAGGRVGVLYLDLDDFKPVNDDLGHAAGDEVLRVVAERIRTSIRPHDLVARLGGDEYAILCADATDEAGIVSLAERLVGHIAEPLTVAGARVRVAASIGVAFGAPAMSADQLIERADGAQRMAKADGKGRWRVAR